jgi:5'-3' exonuclease
MGIRNLNRFIQNKCPGASSRIHLRDLSGKRIAVDTSIYMYRYSGEGALLENMYLMASVFRHYNIHAVFVFDGPPPPQKTDVIEMRKKKKDEAKKQYDALVKIAKEKKDASGCEITTTELDDIEETMRELKKQFVRLRDCDISNVKELLVSFGFATVDAEGEADALCAKLSIKRRVDACLSDDTDMFVYGCPTVLRNISLLNHSVISYSTPEILKTLSLTQQEFKMMCVVSGTDYSQTANSTYVSPDAVFKKITKFKTLTAKELQKYHDSGGGFYDWYTESHEQKKPQQNSSKPIITGSGSSSQVVKSDKAKEDAGAIIYILNESMFDITNSSSNNQYKQLVVLNRDNIQRTRIVEIMMKEDFIFIEPSPSDDVIIQSLSSGTGSLTSSPVYGLEQSHDKHATLLANEVYGINASSFQELHTFHKQQQQKHAKSRNR